MLFASSRSSTSDTYVAYVCTDQGAALARAVVEQSGGTSSDLHGGGLSGAARLGAGELIAETVLAEIGNIPVEMACECVTEICNSGANVIVVGEHTDITTYRALLRAGATDYFGFPVTAAEILESKTGAPSASNIVQIPIPPNMATSIAVMGSNGGVGASLLAQNLAFHSASIKGANLRTGLLDADLQFGSQAIDLDRDETAGFFEALMTPDRIDSTFVKATMDQINDRLSLYSNQVGIEQDAMPYEGGLAGIYPRMRAEFGAIVTDLPRDTMMRRTALAEHFDALVLVIPAGFSGVNAASRMIKQISARHPDLHIVPVLSQVRQDAKLSLKDIKSTIGRDIAVTLPRCDAQMSRAQRSAKPMIETQARSPYAKAVRAIWAAALDAKKAQQEPQQARPLLKRVFG